MLKCWSVIVGWDHDSENTKPQEIERGHRPADNLAIKDYNVMFEYSEMIQLKNAIN